MFTVTASDTSTSPVTVEFATANATAVAGSDYTATSGTLTIEPNTLTASIAVPVLDDTLVEANESFTVTLSGASGATIETATGTATIHDDDRDKALPRLRIGNVSVDEAPGASAVFTVTASDTSTSPVTVEFATANATAVAGSDYTATSGTLTIEPNTLTASIAVPVLDDTLVEADESFTVTLSGASGATIETATGTATIHDDDRDKALPRLRIGNVSVDEAPARARCSPSPRAIRAPVPVTVRVCHRQRDRRRRLGLHRHQRYAHHRAQHPHRIHRRAGARRHPVEANESFIITLSNAVNATILTERGVGTIHDDDADSEHPPRGPGLRIDDVTVDEDAENAVFTVRSSDGGGKRVTVRYATADRTARAGQDYRRRRGTLTFNPRQSIATIRVPVIDDDLVEQTETFAVILSDAIGTTILDREGIGRIQDDDIPPVTVSFGAGLYEVPEGPENARCRRD